MADIAKAALRNRVLEHLNVIAAGETPATADQTLVEEVIDSAHDVLRRVGLVPFPTSAIPSWAQGALRGWVVAAVGPFYGKPWNEAQVAAFKKTAEQELARGVASFKTNTSIRGKYF